MSRCWIFVDSDCHLQFHGEFIKIEKGTMLRSIGGEKFTLRQSALQSLERKGGTVACLCQMQNPFELSLVKTREDPQQLFVEVKPLLKGTQVLVEDVRSVERVMHQYAIQSAKDCLAVAGIEQHVPQAAYLLSIKEQWAAMRATDQELEEASNQASTLYAKLGDDARLANDIISTLTAVIKLSVMQLVIRCMGREPVDTLQATVWELIRFRCKLRAREFALEQVHKLPPVVARSLADHQDKSAEIGVQLEQRARGWLNEVTREVSDEFDEYLLTNVFGVREGVGEKQPTKAS